MPIYSPLLYPDVCPGESHCRNSVDDRDICLYIQLHPHAFTPRIVSSTRFLLRAYCSRRHHRDPTTVDFIRSFIRAGGLRRDGGGRALAGKGRAAQLLFPAVWPLTSLIELRTYRGNANGRGKAMRLRGGLKGLDGLLHKAPRANAVQ